MLELRCPSRTPTGFALQVIETEIVGDSDGLVLGTPTGFALQVIETLAWGLGLSFSGTPTGFALQVIETFTSSQGTHLSRYTDRVRPTGD